jgi:SHS2 domain-containing protein
MKAHFEPFDTTGDVGLNIYGKELKDIFEQAAYGLFSFITNFENIETTITKDVQVNSDSLEELFVKWLNELIFIFETEGFIAKKITINNLTNNKISATLEGETFDEQKHSRGVLIKAATYHKLIIKKSKNGYTARVLFDI